MGSTFSDSLLKRFKRLKSLSFKKAKAELEESLGRELTEEEEFELLVATRRVTLASQVDGARLDVEMPFRLPRSDSDDV